MKIAALMPTRSRPEMAQLAIKSLFEKCYQYKNFKVFILLDKDDNANSMLLKQATKDFPNLVFFENQQTKTMGEMVNELQKKAESECDIFIPFPDDYRIVTQNWDSIIFDMFSNKKEIPECCYFNDSIVPENQATFTVLNKKWIESVGRYVTNYFPFWFDDVWLDEVAQMVGVKKKINISVNCFSGKGTTPRMKNLPFWNSFFRNTISERLSDANKLITIKYSSEPNKIFEQSSFARNFALNYLKKVKTNKDSILKIWENKFADNSSFWNANKNKLIKYYSFEAKAVAKLLSLMTNQEDIQSFVSNKSILKNISQSEIASKSALKKLKKLFSPPPFSFLRNRVSKKLFGFD